MTSQQRRWWIRALAWLGDVLLGPPCPAGCGYYSRGLRTLHDHLDANPGCRAIHDQQQREGAR